MNKKNQSSGFNQRMPMMLAACSLTMMLWSCDRFQSGYVGFQKHDKKYFVEVAKACNDLLSQTNPVSGKETIRGDAKSLPTPLLDLHATTITVTRHLQVGTNYASGVTVIFGEGRPDYTITWHQNNYGNGCEPWELSANGDGVYNVVFSTTNSFH